MKKLVIAILLLTVSSAWASYDFRTNLELKPILGRMTIESDTFSQDQVGLPRNIIIGAVDASVYFKNLSIRGKVGYSYGGGNGEVIIPKTNMLLDSPTEMESIPVESSYKIGIGRLFIGKPFNYEDKVIVEIGTVCLLNGVAINAEGNDYSHSISSIRADYGLGGTAVWNAGDNATVQGMLGWTPKSHDVDLKVSYAKGNVLGSIGYWIRQTTCGDARIKLQGPYISAGVLF